MRPAHARKISRRWVRTMSAVGLCGDDHAAAFAPLSRRAQARTRCARLRTCAQAACDRFAVATRGGRARGRRRVEAWEAANVADAAPDGTAQRRRHGSRFAFVRIAASRGARSRTRTGIPLRVADFKSAASTDFAIRAGCGDAASLADPLARLARAARRAAVARRSRACADVAVQRPASALAAPAAAAPQGPVARSRAWNSIHSPRSSRLGARNDAPASPR